jgi:hypothetical protein
MYSLHGWGEPDEVLKNLIFPWTSRMIEINGWPQCPGTALTAKTVWDIANSMPQNPKEAISYKLLFLNSLTLMGASVVPFKSPSPWTKIQTLEFLFQNIREETLETLGILEARAP